jgi:hypothetical protein
MSDTYGYDVWKTTEPEREPAPAVKHRCLECGWTGHGSAAYAHHRDRHHRIEVVGVGLAVFSCCARRALEKQSA